MDKPVLIMVSKGASWVSSWLIFMTVAKRTHNDDYLFSFVIMLYDNTE